VIFQLVYFLYLSSQEIYSLRRDVQWVVKPILRDWAANVATDLIIMFFFHKIVCFLRTATISQ